MYILFVVAAV